MNVRHNDDDRPNPAGAAAVAERGGGHDASHREWRWITAGQEWAAFNKLFLGQQDIFELGKMVFRSTTECRIFPGMEKSAFMLKRH